MEQLFTGTYNFIFMQYQQSFNHTKQVPITSHVTFVSSLTEAQLQYFYRTYDTDNSNAMVGEIEDNDRDMRQELDNLRNELKQRITALDFSQSRILENEQTLTTLSNQIQTLLQHNRKLEETLQQEAAQWQYKESSYLNIINAAKATNEKIKQDAASQLSELQQANATTTVSKVGPRPTVTDGTFDDNFRNIDSLNEAFSSFEYNAIQLFETIDNMVSNELAEFLFKILLTTTGVTSETSFSFSVENLKILLIIIEGALRTYPDTAIDEAIDYIRNRLSAGQLTFRDPMFLATRHVPNSLQSLIFSNLTSMYRQKFDIMPTVSSVDLFRRHIPVTGLNTFRYDPNNAKTSIFIYETETRNKLGIQ